MYGVVHLGISDHDFIFCVNKLAKVPRPQPRYIRNRDWKKLDDALFLKDLMQFPWSVVETFDNVNDCWDFIHGVFTGFLDAHAPFTSKRVRGDNLTPWVTDDIRDLKHNRDYLKRKLANAKKANLDFNIRNAIFEEYKTARNLVNTTMTYAKKEYFNNLILENMGKSDRLWASLKKILPKSANVSPHEMVF